MRFSPRHAGPVPEWVNGGVACGTLAAELPGGAVTVRLERPVPIDSELPVEVVDDSVELRDAAGDRLAIARRSELELDDVVPFVGVEAAEATTPMVPRDHHPAAGCFVCGPQHPSGLDLQPGPVAGGSCVATVLHVRDDLADGHDRTLEPSVVWAAMDCPGWYAGCEGEMALLGTMTARQIAPIRAGDDIVVQAWRKDREGRKVLVGSALYSTGGVLLAAASAVWIMTPEPR